MNVSSAKARKVTKISSIDGLSLRPGKDRVGLVVDGRGWMLCVVLVIKAAHRQIMIAGVQRL